MTKQDFLKKIEDTKKTLNNFNAEKQTFNTQIQQYENVRNNYNIKEISEPIKNTDDLIKEKIFEEQKIKADKEDLKNLVDLKNDFNFLINLLKITESQCRLYINKIGIRFNTIAEMHKRLKRQLHGISMIDYDSTLDYLMAVKKRLQPLYEIYIKFKITSHQDAIEKFKKLEKKQNKLNTEILNLKNNKKNLKLQVNPFPKVGFAKKIMNNEKNDAKRYIEKLDMIKRIHEFEEIKQEIYDDIIATYKIDNLKSRFEQLINFSKTYIENLNYLISDFVKERNTNFVKRINILKKLEQTEMVNSIKDIQQLVSSFERISDFSDLTEKLIDKYGKKPIPTSNLTTANSLFEKGEFYVLKTPFGTVRVENNNSNELMIYPKGKSTPPTYDVIALKLDNLCTDYEKCLSPQKIIVGVIDPIINYLKQSTPVLSQENLKGQELLNKITGNTSPSVNFSFLENDQIEAAAVLSGILMLSESHQVRNPTLGKLERSSIKRVKQLILKKIKNPFSKVFLNKTGEYIPAHDHTSDLKIFIEKSGGSGQTKTLLHCKMWNGEIAIRTSDIPRCSKTKAERKDKVSIELDRAKKCSFKKTTGKPTSGQDYIFLKDLPNTVKFDFFENKTIKEFIEPQVLKNLRRLYKTRYRT